MYISRCTHFKEAIVLTPSKVRGNAVQEEQSIVNLGTATNLFTGYRRIFHHHREKSLRQAGRSRTEARSKQQNPNLELLRESTRETKLRYQRNNREAFEIARQNRSKERADGSVVQHPREPHRPSPGHVARFAADVGCPVRDALCYGIYPEKMYN